MTKFRPDYRNILNAALNKRSARIPLYEHNIDAAVMERITGEKFVYHYFKEQPDYSAFFKSYNAFFAGYGYDCVTYEAGLCEVLPNGGALGQSRAGFIDSAEKFADYPFGRVAELYAEYFDKKFAALKKFMPDGMLAVGGVGNGVFEIAQDLCGFEGLCVLKYDEPEVYAGLFKSIGDMMYKTWEWFLKAYGDVYCVVRFGDDLGYKLSTMLPPEDISAHIVPQYKRIVELAHSYNKPFLLHSCGNIFGVMDELIDSAKIDAKHSNEDQIAPMDKWVQLYGSKIGNFGGIDTDHLVRMDDELLQKETERVYALAASKDGGFAMGSGNSIPYYVDPQKYLLMLRTVRTLRGDG